MPKKKKYTDQNQYSSSDTNPEFNFDLEPDRGINTEDDLDLIFDNEDDVDSNEDEMITDSNND